jgi:hypothetical protein
MGCSKQGLRHVASQQASAKKFEMLTGGRVVRKAIAKPFHLNSNILQLRDKSVLQRNQKSFCLRIWEKLVEELCILWLVQTVLSARQHQNTATNSLQ